MKDAPFNFNGEHVAGTGGFTSHVFASLQCVGNTLPGGFASTNFLMESAGYCIDAPMLMPAGASKFDKNLTGPAQRYTSRPE